jgi:transcriptional regulator of acetoin/glycerol metabolism
MEISKALSRHREFVFSVASGEVHDNAVDSRISASWRRCLGEYGLDPKDRPDPVVVSAGTLREHQQRNGDLLTIASVEMANLYQQISGSGHSIMLTDNTGLVLKYIGDPAFSRLASVSGLAEGATWSESLQGTNGMGTCLADSSPVIVHQEEHFFNSNLSLTCTSSPIMDADDRVIAVLDASSESVKAQQHTMVLVNMSAKMIENRVMMTAFRQHFIVRFHSRIEFINTLGEGLIAFCGDGTVLAANRNALFQLDYRSNEEIRSHNIDELFDTSLPALLKHTAWPVIKAEPLHDSRHRRRFYAVVQLPDLPPPTSSHGVTAGDAGGDRDTSGNNLLDTLEFGDPQMSRNIRVAQRVLDKGIPILVAGESGTGKGVFARALHLASQRAAKPFVAINCASIPESLIESELFGYKAGAFTGASRHGSMGKIVQADGGTLFLDEIGDMPLSLQARLLRVLEEKEVVPLGGHEPVSVDLCVISATHRELADMVSVGTFREDLFYRLQGVRVSLPPLRERSDRRRLIMHLIELETGDGPAIEIDEDVYEKLVSHPWPGNIRQMRNVLRTMLALAESRHITTANLIGDLFHAQRPTVAAEQGNDDDTASAPEDLLRHAERDALLQELEKHHWNVSSTARRLKISRNTLYRKLRRCRISLPK